jgi:hypothetical protein
MTEHFDDDAAEALRRIQRARVPEREMEWQRRNDARVGDEHPPREGIVPVPTRIRDELHPDRERYRLVRWTDL